MAGRRRPDTLVWTVDRPDRAALRRDGWHVVEFREVRERFIEPARRVGVERRSLANPGQAMLEKLERDAPLAVLNVPVNTLGDLRDVYGYLVEPAYRLGVGLLIHANVDLDDVDPGALVDPEFGYAWTLERLRFLATRFRLGPARDGRPPMTPIEEILLVAMEELGLKPQAQYGIERYRADFAFPASRLTVECDGRGWHDAQRDARRDRHLRQLGWETLRFSGSRIVRDPRGVADEVQEKLDKLSEAILYSDLPAPAPAALSWWRRLLQGLRRRRRPIAEFLDDDEPSVRQPRHQLDGDQRAATEGHDGVVQVIAPAGSGKTKVMVARVDELLSRGVPSNRILCTTFNKRAQQELQDRLAGTVNVGPNGVTVRSFHALGRHILKEEGRLRANIGSVSYAQWRRLAFQAKDTPGGVWIDPADAQDRVGRFKLVDLASPAEALKSAKTAEECTAARIYDLYERLLEEQERLDFDDLILRSLQLLRTDASIRRRWQGRWESVLVDEYQDIEPAQELLVQILAAPHDSLFCVGDEDQCIYTWRRARVERIIELDQRYPGVQRFVLHRNYRSCSAVVEASARLIGHNRRRFPKRIESAISEQGTIEALAYGSLTEAADHVPQLVVDSEPGRVVVLARTTALLRSVAIACARHGVPFNAPDKALSDGDGSQATLLAYLRLLAAPGEASEEDVRVVFRIPNRYLPDGAERSMVRLLRDGAGFAEAAAAFGGADWRARAVASGAELFDSLKGKTEAADVIHRLRTDGKLDQYYSAREQMSPHDQSDIDALNAAQRAAAGMSTEGFVARLQEEAQLLETMRHKDGVELTTIHGAKGREWDKVVLFGADEGELPHARTLATEAATADPEMAVEEERRLAYVAVTRAKQHLIVVHTAEKPSRFLIEAGFSPSEDDPSS